MKELLENFFQSKISKDNFLKKFVDFLKKRCSLAGDFPSLHLDSTKVECATDKIEALKSFSDLFTTVRTLGYMPLECGSDIEHVAIFAVVCAKEISERSCRRKQFDFAQKAAALPGQLRVWFEKNDSDPCNAIFIFLAPDGKSFRLSLIERAKSSEKKIFKRYTFFVSDDQANKTFCDRMKATGKWRTFSDLKDTFSVEKLSDDFFKAYTEKHYQDFVSFATGIRMGYKGKKWVVTERKEPNLAIMEQFKNFADPEKALRDYVKKMMGRLVFLQFLQKKGWLGVPEGAEWGNGDKEYLKNLFDQTRHQDDFLEKVLEPLFFGTLNKDRRTEKYIADDVLAINGCKVRIPYLNGGLFEKDKLDKAKIKFPSEYFDGLFDTFERYNFTIDENDPDDKEVGVDPEMLGRIFENLLEDNKDKGAYYTPKEIVQYMCEESLIAYLGDSEVNRKLVRTFDAADISQEVRDGLIAKLKDVKICDPAIGSGAFPMGMLNILYRLRLILEGQEFTSENIVAVKKEIIQNNIYGVDIEAGAVDIARLRFWLSIIVDEDKKKKPIPLPNLDYKIMQGNSLLEQYNGVDLKLDFRATDKKGKKVNTQVIEQQMCFAWDDETQALENLKAAMNDFFEPDAGANKNQLRSAIDAAVKNYIKTKCGNAPSINAAVDAMDLNDKPFFLWHLYFADVFVKKGGFDIVIGNPPYGANIDAEIDIYSVEYNDVIHEYSDIYKMFFKLGTQLLNKQGVLSYITPDTFLIQPRYSDLRKFILNKRLQMVIDLGESVFEEVTVPVCISILKNQNTAKQYKFLDLKRKYSGDFISPKYEHIAITDKSVQSLIPIISGDLTLADIMELKDPGIQYHKIGNRGQNTLYARLFANDSYRFEHSQPCWYGKLVTPYRISDTDEFFNMEYRDSLEENESVSYTLQVFNRSPKFLWRQTASRLIAAIDFDRKWHRNTLQCGYIKDSYVEKINPYFLLAILNSSYLAYCYDMAVRETGKTFPQIRLAFLKNLPMVIPEKSIQDTIGAKVSEIITCDSEQFTIIANEINEMIFDCFQLSDEMRKRVQEFIALSKVKRKKGKKAAPAAPIAADADDIGDEDEGYR